jgi:hypothetical protein
MILTKISGHFHVNFSFSAPVVLEKQIFFYLITPLQFYIFEIISTSKRTCPLFEQTLIPFTKDNSFGTEFG